MTSVQPPPVIVVGAGIAGLTCARLLTQTGTSVAVVEAGDAIGGRVRTDRTSDGFVLDRGFQVLFTAYPALRRVLDLRTLDLRLFDNGAAVVTGHGPVFLRDPLRHPWHALATLSSPLLTVGDRVRFARLALGLATAHWDGVRDVPDAGRSAEEELHALGFSDGMIAAFFRPFLAGIRLRPDLRVSAAVALFDLRMLLRGRAALPARGMRALPELLAQGLPPGSVRLNTPVRELVFDAARRVVGVRTPHGELRGSAVILATDGDTTARLTGLQVPRVDLGSATLYLAGQQRLFTQKLLVLNALPDAFVNDATLLTNIAPEYAPSGWHLLAAHVLDANHLDDGTLQARARADLQRWFPHVDLVGWRTLSVVRTPRSQFQQPPQAGGELPATRTPWPGLYVAGEITEDRSLNGAMRSGEAAARIVSNDLQPRP
ncbi:MAG TPA: NAD(P)/FAD-dependent oxidoreductase [Chloroflexota bacterium]